MAQTQRLDIRQTQSLVMTPQLQQAIKLLQMSNQELGEFVAQEIEQNPLLEGGDGNDGALDTAPGGDEPGEAAASTSESAEDLSGDGLTLESNEDWDNDDGALSAEGYGATRRNAYDDDDYDAAQNVAERPSLREHLLSQIQVDIADPVDRMIAVALMEMLDESGYLPAEMELARVQLGLTAERLNHVVAQMQRFDPSGICARSLQECLEIQLRDKDRLDPAMQALVQHLDLVAKRDRAGLMKLCGVDAEDLTDMIAEIRLLNPKPALAFHADVAQSITPDVMLRALPGGGWHVELNNDNLPRVLANERYYARVQGAARTKSDKDYLSERWQQANWLVKALNQRATTILKVASEIVRQQDAFFVHGVQHLKPLILRDIAAAVEMHESTVSRVTQHKYIATPRGLFELKYFFTTALARTDGGETVSSEAVRQRILELINAEDPKKILSDDRIAEILHGEGIEVARRTVAKYREAMHIPSSAQRRREKK